VNSSTVLSNAKYHDNLDSLNDNCIFNAIKDFYVQNKNQCKIGHININSIRNKFEPVKEILQENNYVRCYEYSGV
jgi:hypothetical protein